jgi:hypothetical protein
MFSSKGALADEKMRGVIHALGYLLAAVCGPAG